MLKKLIQFNLWQVAAVVPLETVDSCLKVSLLYEAHVLVFSLILHCERPSFHHHLVLPGGRVGNRF